MTPFIVEGRVYRWCESTGNLFQGLMCVATDVPSLGAARDRVGAKILSEQIEDAEFNHAPASVSSQQVAMALRESQEFKPTEAICSAIAAIAERRLFYPSTTLLELRAPGAPRIEYTMLDGSSVSVSKDLAEQLCKRIDPEDTEQIRSVTQATESFIAFTRTLIEEQHG